MSRFFTWITKHYRLRNALTLLCSEVFSRRKVIGRTVLSESLERRWYVFGLLVFEHQLWGGE